MMEFQFYYFGGTKLDQTAGGVEDESWEEDKGKVEEKDEAEANVVRPPGKPTMNFHSRFMSKHLEILITKKCHLSQPHLVVAEVVGIIECYLVVTWMHYEATL